MLMNNIKNCIYMLYDKRSDIYFIDFSYKILRLSILQNRKIIDEIIACFLQKCTFLFIYKMPLFSYKLEFIKKIMN